MRTVWNETYVCNAQTQQCEAPDNGNDACTAEPNSCQETKSAVVHPQLANVFCDSDDDRG